MYEQICFFISTHPFIQFLVTILGFFFTMFSLFFLLLSIAGILSYVYVKEKKEKANWDWQKQFIIMCFLTFIITGLLAVPFIVTFRGLIKYDTQQVKDGWLITKNRKIIYLNDLKIIKSNKLPIGFYYTILGIQIKIKPLPTIYRLPVIDYYDSLYVLSNNQIIRTKKFNLHKFQVDSWAQNMSPKWKDKHYTFWMWEWKYGLNWKSGQLIKYTPF